MPLEKGKYKEKIAGIGQHIDSNQRQLNSVHHETTKLQQFYFMSSALRIYI
jgi:hypothetical protein